MQPPPARGFDVLCLPIIDWEFRFQRPQQLMTRFTEDGHRVFYLKTGLLGLDREPVLRALAERVFEVALPGEHDFNVYSGALEGETLAQAAEALGEVLEQQRVSEAVIVVR